MILTLTRDTLSPATLGRLSVDGVYHSDTLELPWLDNQAEISCIPPGIYPVVFAPSPHFWREMLHLGNTGTRKGILIHAANQVEELRGCIALGKRHGPTTLIESRPAVDKLESMVLLAMDRKEQVTLEIRNHEVTV